MRSRIPKVLHPLAGRPMIEHVLSSLAAAGIEHPVVVIGFGADQLEAALADRVPTVRQEPQLGTADAVRRGLERVPAEARHVLVTMGDVPLLPPDLFQRLLREQAEGEATIALLSATLDDPQGYGRIVRGADGAARAIVEERDADDAIRAGREVTVGTYCFDAAWLRANAGSVPASASGEYYLTDLVEVAAAGGRRVAVVTAPRAELTTGINDRAQLAAADRLLRDAIIAEHLRNGVTIVDPATTHIDAGVEIGQDARIEPFTILSGSTVIAQDAVIGPRCRIGNYAELKNTTLGAGTQQHHFSYLGDADVGEDVNIGAGTITANFDGERKQRTTIGRSAFIGVDTMLRAPVTIGEGARTGAGAVVTRDVAPGTTVVGMPARPIEARRRRAELAADRNPQQGGGTPPPDA
jgi:bifunctional UDP-N-acetylglucosamine pyrophosphorylase/glucosamine-1-phosphate N-acetyltransferase